jgi:DNA adenine methylase
VTAKIHQQARSGTVPHFLPYQGSKRRLASRILAMVAERRFTRLFEPFAGSGAITLAAAHAGLADRYVLGESLAPLAALWQRVLEQPDAVADRYGQMWLEPHGFSAVRDAYNADFEPAALLYLLARCVKNAPRWSQAGHFNQSADLRRVGVQPERLRMQLRAVAALLAGRCQVRHADFMELLADAMPGDLVYLDPPWLGTTTGKDRRYHQGLTEARLLTGLADLRARGVPFLLSYDGSCGERAYAPPLPDALGLTRVELIAGRSSQATLAGRDEITVESLYLSPGLS